MPLGEFKGTTVHWLIERTVTNPNPNNVPLNSGILPFAGCRQCLVQPLKDMQLWSRTRMTGNRCIGYNSRG